MIGIACDALKEIVECGKRKIIIIYGPTSSGKSALAVSLAATMTTINRDAVIINADAMQVYKEIPIITSQPPMDRRCGIKHALYGIISVTEHFSVQKWMYLAQLEVDLCLQNGVIPIVVGGSGMYIKSLICGLSYIPEISSYNMMVIDEIVSSYIATHGETDGCCLLHDVVMACDPIFGKNINKNDIMRMKRCLMVYQQTGVPLSQWRDYDKKGVNLCKYRRDDFFVIMLTPNRGDLYSRINRDVMFRLLNGGVDEVVELLSLSRLGIDELCLDVDKNKLKTGYKAIGILNIMKYLAGKVSWNDTICEIQKKTRHYAKRQMTWGRHQVVADLVL